MRRLAPRALSAALDDVVRDVAPLTLLARVQAVWTDAAGERLATAAAPVSEREGVVTVACKSGVWAHELDLLAPDLLRRLEGALGGAARNEVALRRRFVAERSLRRAILPRFAGIL